MPSNTPPGGRSSGNPTAQVTITVTYNGEDSAPTTFQGVGGGAGLFTIDSSGSGPGIVTYPDYSLVSAVKGRELRRAKHGMRRRQYGRHSDALGDRTGHSAGRRWSRLAGAEHPHSPLSVWVGGVQAPSCIKADPDAASGWTRSSSRFRPMCPQGAPYRWWFRSQQCQQQHRNPGGERQPDLHARRPHDSGREHTAVGVPSIAHAGDCASRHFRNAYRAGEIHLRAGLHPASGAAFPCVLPRPAAARHLHRSSVP